MNVLVINASLKENKSNSYILTTAFINVLNKLEKNLLPIKVFEMMANAN